MTSGHLITLQAVAWTKMLLDYSKVLTIKEAVKNTFDGEHPCELCKKIEKVKQTEQKPLDVQFPIKKNLFFADSHSMNLGVLSSFGYSVGSQKNLPLLPPSPLVPPPKIS